MAEVTLECSIPNESLVADGTSIVVLRDDNIVEVPLADESDVSEVIIDYTVELPVSRLKQRGQLQFFLTDGAVVFDHEYTFRRKEIFGVSFSGSLTGGKINMVVATNQVGENPTLRYKQRVSFSL